MLRLGDAALTGPVSRGDVATVATHVDTLGRAAPDVAAGLPRDGPAHGRARARRRPADRRAGRRRAGGAGVKVVQTRGRLRGRARPGWPAPVGLVPTMGALHAGHAALLDAARGRVRRRWSPPTSSTRCSSARPRTSPATRARSTPTSRCASAGVDVVWAPTVADVYPHGGSAGHASSPGRWATQLEGEVRPGHFAGVLTVVAKFLNLVRPDRGLLRREGLPAADADPADGRATSTSASTVVGVPTVREPDGLALSSRNATCRADERRRALALSRALFAGRDAARAGGALAAITTATGELAAEPGVAVDYLELRGADLGEIPEHGVGPAAGRGPGRQHPADRQRRGRAVTALPAPAGRARAGLDGRDRRRRRRLGHRRADHRAAHQPAVVAARAAGDQGRARRRARRAGRRAASPPRSAPATRPTSTSPTRSSPAPACATRPRCACWCARGRPRCASWPRWARASTAPLDGELSLTREGGHHRDRIAHAGGDATGAEIERALVTRVLDATGVEVIEHALRARPADHARRRGRRADAARDGRGRSATASARCGRARSCWPPAASARCTRRPPTRACRPATASRPRCAPARWCATSSSCSSTRPSTWLGPHSRGQQPLVSEAVRGEGAFLVDDAGDAVHARPARARRSRAARRRGQGDPAAHARDRRRARVARRPALRRREVAGALPDDLRHAALARHRPGAPT